MVDFIHNCDLQTTMRHYKQLCDKLFRNTVSRALELNFENG